MSSATGVHLSKYCFMVWLLFVALLPRHSYAQQQPNYEELILSFMSRVAGNADMPALVYNDSAYLPANDLFDFLKIKNSFSPAYDSLTGFITGPADLFSINLRRLTIHYKNMEYRLKPADIIFLNNDYYINAFYFGNIFGLQCNFQFRSLSINFNTNIELPIVKEQRLQTMRQNLSKLKGERKADTILKNEFSLLKLGVMDWDVAATQLGNKKNALMRLGFGGMLAGGDITAYFNHNSQWPLSWNQQFVQWKYVNNSWTGIKQISAGRIQSASALSLYNPMLGVQVTNSPSYRKKSLGTYLVSSNTEPNWIVELYVNDVLVDYTRADAAGLFSFEVPMMYGNSNIKYKYYGPWGEERFSEQQLSIPFTLLPAKQMEYIATAGYQQDSSQALFTRAQANYGLSRRITIGAGAEWNQALPLHKAMPFATASLRLGNATILFAEHVPGIVSKGNLYYRYKTHMQLDVNYAKYTEGQQAIRTNALDELKLSLSSPLRFRLFNGVGRVIFNRTHFAKTTISTAEALVGGSLGKISGNIGANMVMGLQKTFISKASLSTQLPFKIRFTAQAQYAHTNNKWMQWRVDAERLMFNSLLVNGGYENNRLLGSKGFHLGIRKMFGFAQVNVTAKQMQPGKMLLTQNANGSLLLGKNVKNIKAQSQKGVGRGGLLVLPFLDYNFNGSKDAGEPVAKGLVARVDGAQVQTNHANHTIRVTGMEAYVKYFLVLDAGSFENPAWQITNKVMAITAQPNITRTIEVPVTIAGEATGYVYTLAETGKAGLGRVIVNIFNEQMQPIAKTLSEADGYFSYLGLAPGKYFASVDEAQLKKINRKQVNDPVAFVIKTSAEGDIAEGIELLLYDK